jgi:hypothetical protein
MNILVQEYKDHTRPDIPNVSSCSDFGRNAI